MSIVIGGNFASGGLDGFTFQSVDGKLGNRLALTNYGGRTVLRSTVAHRDAVDSASLRSELSTPSNRPVWGREFRAVWSFIVPPEWQTYAGEAWTTVIQMHDLDLAGIPRRPVFEAAIKAGALDYTAAHDDAPAGDLLHSHAVLPGQEVTVGLAVKWADGTNEPTVNGHLELFVDGALVAARGGRNHWATVDTNPPYLKCGAYVPVSGDAWWAGKSRTMYHIGAVLADGGEPLSDLERLVRTQTIGASPQRLRR